SSDLEGDGFCRHSPGDEVVAHRLTQGDDSVGRRGDLDLLGPHECEALTVPSCGAFVRAAPSGCPRLFEDTSDLVHPWQTRCGRRRPRCQSVDVMRGRVEYLSPAVHCLSGDPARLITQTRSGCGPWAQRHLAQIIDAVDGLDRTRAHAPDRHRI